MTATFDVGIYDFTGNYLRSLNFISIQYARALRTTGSCTLVLPDYYSEALFGRDTIMRIYRRAEGGPNYLEPSAVWFARKISHDHKTHMLTVTFADQMSLLERRIVAYNAQSLYADKTFDEGNAPAPADDLMKAYVRENLGSLVVDGERDLSLYLSVEDDKGLAPAVEIAGAYQKISDILNNLAKLSEDAGTMLFYDIAATGPLEFEFRTFVQSMGSDRRDAISISSDGGNIDNLISEIDYGNELTVAYIGGDGSGWTKYVREVQAADRIDLTPFNRIETYFDTNEDHTDDYMDFVGGKILNGGKPKKRISANIIDSPGKRYGRDFFYGDYLNVVLEGDVYQCHITAINNSIADGRETLTIRLDGELTVS